MNPKYILIPPKKIPTGSNFHGQTTHYFMVDVDTINAKAEQGYKLISFVGQFRNEAVMELQT